MGHNLHGISRSGRDGRAYSAVRKRIWSEILIFFKNLLFQIFQISLQILQNPIKLNAFQLFELNYDLLKGIVAAILTYMVIFVSFLPEKTIFTDDYEAMNQLFK